ncbi:hypothetical protein PR048_033058 [Dryococelus australis]|uniref:Uncharacterized protein n=1 Tax=Dryococelus australis TaxID=614101 RepID=A0ABQ9FZ63_9NEOP|nr:hypothetical protein PR048_033058 [Dryococelus australis]
MDDAARRRFSRGSPVSQAPSNPSLLYTHLASPSSALKTSMLIAAKISSFAHFTGLFSERNKFNEFSNCSDPYTYVDFGSVPGSIDVLPETMVPVLEYASSVTTEVGGHLWPAQLPAFISVLCGCLNPEETTGSSENGAELGRWLVASCLWERGVGTSSLTLSSREPSTPHLSLVERGEAVTNCGSHTQDNNEKRQHRQDSTHRAQQGPITRGGVRSVGGATRTKEGDRQANNGSGAGEYMVRDPDIPVNTL